MDNFKDSRVVHSPKIQRNFPRALLVDHLHDRWAAWVMETKQDAFIFSKRMRDVYTYMGYLYTHYIQNVIYDYHVKGILVFVHIYYVFVYAILLCIWVFPKKRGTPKSSIINHFNRVFPYKPSILGYHYFWKHPYIYILFKHRNVPEFFTLNLRGKPWS